MMTTMMTNKHALIVEDEEDILKLLEITLKKGGYEVTGVNTGEKAVELVKTSLFDFVVLDLMLPGINGLDICRNFRNNNALKGLPIIMLTAKGEEEDILKGLACGADDYITKPFSPKILLARINSVLRRQNNADYDKSSIISFDNLYIHPTKYEVTLEGEPLVLTPAEFKVLHLLASRPGWVLSRYKIIDEIKGEDYSVTDRSVDVLMVGLRKKLGNYSSYIETVRGTGYRFKSV